MAVAPTARGLILCESVTVDPVSNNLSMLDCFRALRAEQFPAFVSPFFVMAHLVNGLGDIRLRIGITRLVDHKPVYQFVIPVQFPHRMQERRLKVEVARMQAQEPGRYGVELWANEELIAQTDFTLVGGTT